MSKELTKKQIDRNDFVHNTIFGCIQSLVPNDKEIEWDMELIGGISDVIQDYFVDNDICSEMDFSPYIEE